MKFGPGLLVAAAFIGPGTVLTASKAGANYGFSLFWAVVFSVIAAIVFQEMAARLGIVSGKGLGEALKSSFEIAWVRWAAVALVISAILVGNAAYESGNIAGAVAGAIGYFVGENPDSKDASFFQTYAQQIFVVMISMVAFAILMTGNFRWIQNLLIPIVVVMSLLFILAALFSQPNWGKVLLSLVPTLPKENFSAWAGLCIGLIGTTVVPYNLFLHSSSAAKQWNDTGNVNQSIRESRVDTTLAVGLGGMVTACILITASQSFFEKDATLTSVGDVSKQIKPAIGAYAHAFFCFGLLAAGLTSAITAPLAASFATSGCLGRTTDPKDTVNRLIMGGVILFGLIIALVGKSPAQIILFAQVANGLILPVIALFLIYAMNQKRILASFTNKTVSNVIGGLVIFVIVGIATFKMWKLVGKLLE